MAGYTVIADVGNALVALLREKMVPEVIQNPESIGLCSPEEKGDFLLGVYLYDIRESQEVRRSGMVSVSPAQQRYPSRYLSLYYMLTVFFNGNPKYRASEEQKILGRALQVLTDYSILDPSTLKPISQGRGQGIQIEFSDLSQEEKIKIWTVPNKAVPLSLFFQVGPVELQSDKTKEVKRVKDVDFALKEMG